MNRMSGSVIIIFLLLTGVSSIWAASLAAQETAAKVEIKADRLRVESDRKVAFFEGNVRFSIDAAMFRCARLIVRYSDNGGIESATVEGGIAITISGASAEADRAELNMNKGMVTLLGNPRFSRDHNTLSGKRIQINIRTGEVDVTEATGAFVLPGNAR